MTLIIGVKCSDGAVLGADGAATLGSMGQATIRQPVRSKLSLLSDCVVLGVSGPVGLGQRFKGEVELLWTDRKFATKGGGEPLKPFQAMTVIREALIKHIAPEFEAARIAQSVIGSQLAGMSALASTLVALPIGQALCLFQFDQQGAPEELTADLPFATIGSGQGNADPFMAFIRRIFWRDRLPTVREGVFATLWTLLHSIETSPGRVSEPIQLVQVEKQERKGAPPWLAKSLSEDDLAEHRVAIVAAEDALARFKEGPPSVSAPPE